MYSKRMHELQFTYHIENYIVVLFPLAVMKIKLVVVHFVKEYGGPAGTSGSVSPRHGISSHLLRVEWLPVWKVAVNILNKKTM
jgi:hypothetical protein